MASSNQKPDGDKQIEMGKIDPAQDPASDKGENNLATDRQMLEVDPHDKLTNLVGKPQFAKTGQEMLHEIIRKHSGLFYCHPEYKEPDDNEKRLYYEYSKTAFWCLTDENCLRKGFVWLATWKWFDYFITLAIVLNSILLASTDYEPRLNPDHVSTWTPIQEQMDLVFSIIFIIECCTKVVAMGFVLHKKSYLREAWNILDFFIVMVSVVGFLPIEGGADSLKALRTFRILRPLRSVNKLPVMKQQIQALLGAIPGLMRVFFFIIFIFTIFAIFGTNQFLGQQYQFCRATLEPTYDADGAFVIWDKLGDEDGGDGPALCLTDEQCAFLWDEAPVAVCGNIYEVTGLDPNGLNEDGDQYDGIRDIELIMYGIPGFDNVAHGFLTIFQILTLESWVYLMYNFSDTGSGAISVIFFVAVVLIGAFFTMNLVLAIIVDQFAASREAAAEAIQAKEDQAKEDAAVDADADAEDEELEKDSKDAKDNKGADEVNKEINLGDRLVKKPGDSRIEKIMPDEISNIEKKDQSMEKEEVKKNLKDLETKIENLETQNDAEKRQETDAPFLDQDSEDGQFEEDEDERSARVALKKRVGKNGCIKAIHDFVTSVSFNFFIFILILGNTITLAAYSYDQSDMQTQVLELFNEFFTWIFFIEMIMKLIGLGWSNYKLDSYNLFDAVIVIISLVDWTLSRIPGLDAGSALNAFRALRLLRMMKLSKSWHALAEILRKTAKSLKDIGNFSMLLLLFMYIFALLGMELFANIALIDGDDNLVVGEEAVLELYALGASEGKFYSFPRDNFNSVGWALTTVFIVIIGEDWNWSMYQWVRAYGVGSTVSYHIAVVFFVLLMIMGNIVLFSLFTAILLQNFEGGDEEDEEEEETTKQKIGLGEKWDNFAKGFKEAFGKRIRIAEEEENLDDQPAKKEVYEADILDDDSHMSEVSKNLDEELRIQKQAENDARKLMIKERRILYKRGINTLIHYDPSISELRKQATLKVDGKIKLPPLMGRNTCCMGPENCFRLMCQKICMNKPYFENPILVLILISTVTLALETPLDDPEGEKIKILAYIDLFMTAAFTFEMVIKIIAWGFAFSGKDSYIREPWNILDFLIVTSALMGVIAGDAVKISFFKALRILKILRPLRIIAKNKGLKVAITALGSSLPNIINLQVIVLFFVFLFAILQTTLLSGQFYQCHTDHLGLTKEQQVANIENMWDCLSYGGEWIEPDLNFDTTFASLLTLVTIQTTEGWIDVMWSSVDAVGPYLQPIENNNWFMVIYTMILVIIICMLFIELFVGIVIETFNTQKELMSGNQSLTRRQRAWTEIQLMAMSAKPKVKLDASKVNKCRAWNITMTEHKSFDIFIMLCILGNTFILAFNWYMQPENFLGPIEVVNYTFMIIFTIEAVVKIIAQRALYFKDSWNLFDFTVVFLTIVILTLNWAGIGKDLEILGTILRTLRIGRVFRLIKKQEKLQEIFKTLIEATPAMASLGLLLMLLIFMFAIIGMAQFSLIDLDGASEMNNHVNFQGFGSSFLTLIRCSTGEAWNSIMFDSSQSRSILYQCEEIEDYYTIVERGDDPADTYGPKGCGVGFAVAFHLLFQVIVSQVFLNLFIAIIIDAFFGQTDMASMPVKEKVIEDYQRIWSMYDKDATGFITIGDMKLLLIDITNADPQEAGALILKSSSQDEKERHQFMNRQIMQLEIPTYKNQSEVMFYDVLMKLCHQSVKLYFQQDSLKVIKLQLKVMRKLECGILHDDTLEAIHQKNPHKKEVYDKDLIELMCLMKHKNPKAELVQDLVQANKVLKEEYNHQVDTNLKVVGEENFKKIGNLMKSNPIELYTTKHLGSAMVIYEFMNEYLDRRNARQQPDELQDSRVSSQRDDRQRQLLPINEVSSLAENTKEAGRINSGLKLNSQSDEAVVPVQDGLLNGQPSGQAHAEIQGIPEDDDDDDHSVIPDQHFANLR